MSTLLNLGSALSCLAVFRNLLDAPVFTKFLALAASNGSPSEKAALCGAFAGELYHTTDDFSQYILDCILSDENPYIKRHAAGQVPSQPIQKSLEAELAILQQIAAVTPEFVRTEIAWDGFLPEWHCSDIDFAVTYYAQIDQLSQRGYGIFATHHMFTIGEKGITPVVYPESVRLSDLTGYERERTSIVRNTQALLEGKPAANVLLYGDAGTGKSTCVKAIANEFHERGLRLIELRKEQLFRIPDLLGELSCCPLKFILFIDDLTFSKNDNNFSALKAILEGSVAAKSANIVIYATSNRRHLVLEKFSDREGDEIHLNDTMQELSSLSDRFGLVVTFVRPDREIYQAVVKSYVESYNIPYTDETAQDAEAYALRRGGRSPRVARHFAESLVAQGILD